MVNKIHISIIEISSVAYDGNVMHSHFIKTNLKINKYKDFTNSNVTLHQKKYNPNCVSFIQDSAPAHKTNNSCRMSCHFLAFRLDWFESL